MIVIRLPTSSDHANGLLASGNRLGNCNTRLMPVSGNDSRNTYPGSAAIIPIINIVGGKSLSWVGAISTIMNLD